MMSYWKTWAQRALQRMDAPGWKPRPEDIDEVEDARDSLRQVAEVGAEPYFTLQSFVFLNGLEEDKQRHFGEVQS
jgi:hypothetical protein